MRNFETSEKLCPVTFQLSGIEQFGTKYLEQSKKTDQNCRRLESFVIYFWVLFDFYCRSIISRKGSGHYTMSVASLPFSTLCYEFDDLI